MNRDDLLAALAHPQSAETPGQAYLGFVMIPVAERFGQWRFTGAGRTVGEVLSRLDAAMKALGDDAVGPLASVRRLAEDDVLVWEDPWSSPRGDREALADVEEVVVAVGGAPHDHIGLAVLRVDAAHPYVARRPETRPPTSWSDGDLDDDLDADPDAWLADEGA